jgi:hypothetical protein
MEQMGYPLRSALVRDVSTRPDELLSQANSCQRLKPRGILTACYGSR